MTPDLFLSLVALTIVASFTPGPNNALLAASGANFGLRRTLPHVAGIAVGFPLMALIVGMALGNLFQQSDALRAVLRWGGSGLLLWVAWKIARSGGLGRADRIRPFSFAESLAFQWVNPKGWVMAVALTTQFIHPAQLYVTAGIVGAVCLVFGLLSALAWAGLGQALRRWLAHPVRLRAFNLTMGGLIVLSVLPLLSGEI